MTHPSAKGSISLMRSLSHTYTLLTFPSSHIRTNFIRRRFEISRTDSPRCAKVIRSPPWTKTCGSILRLYIRTAIKGSKAGGRIDVSLPHRGKVMMKSRAVKVEAPAAAVPAMTHPKPPTRVRRRMTRVTAALSRAKITKLLSRTTRREHEL